MNQRPLLALDVDGVLNPFRATQAPRKHFEGYRRHTLKGYRLWLTPEHGKLLLDLDLDIVWATTWEDDANELVAPLVGLPQTLPVLHMNFPDDLRDDGCGKRPALSRFVETRPLIWVDDDLGASDYEWADSLAQPSLLLAPDPHVGLTRPHIEKIGGFVAEHAG